MRRVVLVFSAILFLGSIFSPGKAGMVEDRQALLDFVIHHPHFHALNWGENSSVCSNWTGVTCTADGSGITAVRLPGVGFGGPIPPNTLSRLSSLQILSLRSNGISGHFPSDFVNLRNLSYLYLQFNQFSGPLPDFTAWKNLTIVNLSHNAFTGSIPFSISNLTRLTALNLANNSLSGEIPDFNSPSLQQLDLSDNNFSGVVPKSLGRFPKSAFSGNNVTVLQNSPLDLPIALPPPSKSNPKSRYAGRLSHMALIGIIVAGCILGLVSFVFVVGVCTKRKDVTSFVGKSQKGEMSPDKWVSRIQDANNKLVFFEGCNYAFDMEDLLRASAEVLGKGTFGMAYKAVLEDVTMVAVKRLKDVGVGKRDFEQQMEVVGRIKHENVAELRAYYHSKDEKLMVYDYYSQGSVFALLHGKRGQDRVPLDWDARMRIVIGAARGIARIHSENGGRLVHGNVKSSNIFLNPQEYGCISDVGLTTISSPLPPAVVRAAGYCAPEVIDSRKASQASDVYSFGVVILELLTGKSAVYNTVGGEVIHLVRWVHSVVREEWTAEVFDLELMKYPNIEEEMVELLQIALQCVVRMPDQRPKMTEVVKLVENVRLVDAENQVSSEVSAPQVL